MNESSLLVAAVYDRRTYFWGRIRATVIDRRYRSLGWLLIAFIVSSNLHAADSNIDAKQIRDWRDKHEREILAEFVDLLAIPNLASEAPNIERNAQAIRALFEKRGLTTHLLTHKGAPPIVVADLAVPGAKRTIAFYAHYDGQPVDRTRWKSDPWKPVMRDAAGNDVDWQNAKANRSGMATLCAVCGR